MKIWTPSEVKFKLTYIFINKEELFADSSYRYIFLTLKKKVFPSQLHLVKTVSMGEGIPQTSVILRGGDGGLSGFSIQK